MRSRRATDGARTRDLHLGKVAYYQLYYCRIYFSLCLSDEIYNIICFYKMQALFSFFLYFYAEKKLPLLHITQLTYPVLHPSQNESRRNIPAAFVSALLQNLAVVMSSTHIFRIAQRSAIVFQPRLLAGNRMLHS